MSNHQTWVSAVDMLMLPAAASTQGRLGAVHTILLGRGCWTYADSSWLQDCACPWALEEVGPG